jgi:hypothetical protein
MKDCFKRIKKLENTTFTPCLVGVCIGGVMKTVSCISQSLVGSRFLDAGSYP